MMVLSVFHSKFRNRSDLKPPAVPSTVQITQQLLYNPVSEFVRNLCHPVLMEVTLEWGYRFTRNFFFSVIIKDSYYLNMPCLQMSYPITEQREEMH